MEEKIITAETLAGFDKYLEDRERGAATRENYLRGVRAYMAFLSGGAVSAERTREFKEWLLSRGYAPGSVNTALASLNAFFKFMGWSDCGTNRVRTQKSAYCPEERELKKDEYMRLLKAAGPGRWRLLLETVASTGIRISELKFFTVEAVERGTVTVTCKGKVRGIFVPVKLKKLLLRFAKERGIAEGPIFLDRRGKPVSRGAVWGMMKRLAKKAGVSPGKVFPHSLRKLFARAFYEVSRDIAKLADLLGHSSIDTTRIYIMTSGAEHRRALEKMRLLI